MRRLLIALAVLLVLAAGGELLFWRWAEGRLARGYSSWRDQAQAAGWPVEAGPPARGGWPLAASLTLPRPELRDTGGNVPGGLRWRADAVTLQSRIVGSRRSACGQTASSDCRRRARRRWSTASPSWR